MPATQRKCIYGGLTLDVDRHYIRSGTATTHQEKGIITLESNPSRGTVLPAPQGHGLVKCLINRGCQSVYGHVPECRVHLGDPDAIMFDEIPTSTIELPDRRFQTFPGISLLEKLI